MSVNPLGALFGNFNGAVELPITENIGVEPTAGLIFGTTSNLFDSQWRRSGFSVGGRGKYYFSPEEDNDGFYAQVYARFKRTRFRVKEEDIAFDYYYRRTRVAAGLGVGFKYVADNGLVLDIGVGAGRAIINRYKWDDEYESFFGVGDVFSGLTNLDFDGRLSIGYRLGH